ncbi:MAG: hypothetical protein M1814_000314 [Vezdaea aestivalis]|nr:MAG: hypothetical protein M1814_000314 [Vezdaea aestivalis]
MLNARSIFLLVSALSSFWPAQAYRVAGVTTSVNTQTGQRPSRQEFGAFASSGAAFDLYIQALQLFQANDQSQLLSYYQVSGIHGRPYLAWDGVNGQYPTGYCTHASVLFPTWHRPYLALYEQILANYTQQVAARYTNNRAQYQQAANDFRMPYWDWARNAQMPAQVNQPTISINTPTGQQTITNPLYSYVFHPRPSNSDFPSNDGRITQYSQTVRYPNAQGQSQPDRINQQLAANAGSLHDRTYLLLSRQSSYGAFSNKAYTDSRGQSYDSVEAIHDTIHGLVGNGGHMGYVPYSAFDPVFWLHHTQIDRLFAIWQALYPDSYVTSQQTAFGTFTSAPRSLQDSNTLLTPFHSDDGNGLYTSNAIRSTRTFGYTYPEVQDVDKSPQQLSADTRAAIKQLYDPNGQLGRRNPRPLDLDLDLKLPFDFDFSVNLDFGDTPPLTIPPALKVGPDRNYTEWYINCRVDKNELGQSYFIHFFGGKPKSDPTDWAEDKALVGSYVVFNGVEAQGPDATIYGQIPLTRALTAAYGAGKLKDLTPDSVVPFLRDNLNWGVQLYDDSSVPVEKVTSLKVYVTSTEVTPPKDKARDFPTYGPYIPFLDITKDKKGGLADGGDLVTPTKA